MYYSLASNAKKTPQVVHFTEAFGQNTDGTPLTSGKKIRQSAAPKGIKVYCAGPMFSVGDKHEMSLIAEHLEGQGYETYLPHRDGLELGELMSDLPILQSLKKVKYIEMEYFTYWVQFAIFALDIYCLFIESDVVVMNLNGRVPDEGACCEVAMAFTAGKPIIHYKEDFRSLMMGRDNPMVAGLPIGPVGGFDYCRSLDEIPERIEKTMEWYKKVNKDYDFMKQNKFWPALKIYLDFGAKIKEQRKRLMNKLTELAPSCIGKSREEQCQIRMVAYMDFFTMLVTTTMLLGVPVPDRFAKINMFDLIKLALQK